jgi:2-methylcitrate dehydratase PrpD
MSQAAKSRIDEVGRSVMNPAELLIDHCLALAWEDLPEAARSKARTFLHDSLCVGVAGANAAYAASVRSAVATWGESKDCSVLGCPGLTLPAPSAAFVNAFQIHAQEFDCVHEPAVVHPLATVLAALMAEAERSGPYDGKNFLTALIAGVDVAAGLGVAVTTPLRFFRPATAGIFGSVAALARLKRVPREVALDALGYALAFASGTMQAHIEGKPTLPVQVGNAARGAITALDLASAGLPGPRSSIDGPFGYLPLFETGFDLAPVLAELGRVFRITEVSWKPFPTGRAAHGALVAVQSLVQSGQLSATTLESLTYFAPPLIKRLVGRPATPAMVPSYGRLCLPWLAAIMLGKGNIGLEDFAATTLTDPVLLALAERVSVVDNGNPDPAAFVPAVAVARLTDGRELRVEVSTQFGSPAWPLSSAQHLAKARHCLEFGGLSQVHTTLTDWIDRFEELGDVTPVFRLCAGR